MPKCREIVKRSNNQKELEKGRRKWRKYFVDELSEK